MQRMNYIEKESYKVRIVSLMDLKNMQGDNLYIKLESYTLSIQ